MPRFVLASGSLPDGLTLDATLKVLSGTPTTTGTHIQDPRDEWRRPGCCDAPPDHDGADPPTPDLDKPDGGSAWEPRDHHRDPPRRCGQRPLHRLIGFSGSRLPIRSQPQGGCPVHRETWARHCHCKHRHRICHEHAELHRPSRAAPVVTHFSSTQGPVGTKVTITGTGSAEPRT